MSLKNNIEMVKKELNSEEKFFETAVIAERFIKRYKKAIIGLFIVLVVGIITSIALSINENNRQESANIVYLKLQINPDDKEDALRLKNLSSNMYNAFLYKNAIQNDDLKILEELSKNTSGIMADLASYEFAQKSKDLKKLNNYSKKDGVIYRDLALIRAYKILIMQGKIDKAREKLKNISNDSPLKETVSALLHYGVK